MLLVCCCWSAGGVVPCVKGYITQWSLKVPTKYLPSSIPSTVHETQERQQQQLQQSSQRQSSLSPPQQQGQSQDVNSQIATTNPPPTTLAATGAAVSTLTSPAFQCVPLPDSDEFLAYVTTSPDQDDDDDDEDNNNNNNDNPMVDDEEPNYYYYQHAILEGYLIPNPNFADLPNLHVVISSLRNVCLDPTKNRGRGYWIASNHSPHASYYWLQQPSSNQEPFMLERRAQLGVFSNVLDCGRKVKDWFEKSPIMVHQEFINKFGYEPYSMDLMRANTQHLKRHWLQVVSPIKSPFFRHLSKGNKKSNPLPDHQEVVRLCMEAEKRSQQYSWGGPLMNDDDNNNKKNGDTPSSSTVEVEATKKKRKNDSRTRQQRSIPQLQVAIQQDQQRLLRKTKVSAAKRRRRRHAQEEGEDDDDENIDTVDWSLIESGAKMLRRTNQYQTLRKPSLRRIPFIN